MLRALFSLFLLQASLASAQPVNSPNVSYKCVNGAGKTGVGTGRLSFDNEYSTFLRRYVRAGEFVIFQYAGRGKAYWFTASNCVKA